jgi:hypothetical protein
MAVQKRKNTKSRKSRKSKKKSIFNTYLQKKIAINMKKWKKGRWVSQQQALAVSYCQTREYMKSRNKKNKRLRNKSKSKSKAKSKAKKRNNIYKKNIIIIFTIGNESFSF